MQSTPSLPSLPGPLWLRVVAPGKSSIYVFNRIEPWFLEFTDFFYLNCIFMLNYIARNRTVWTWTWTHRLHFWRGVRPHPNECPRYDAKQSDGEVPVVLELWGILSTPSLPLFPGPLWPGMVTRDRALNKTNCILMLNWIVWNRTIWLNWIA